jgi:hypothetical protein
MPQHKRRRRCNAICHPSQTSPIKKANERCTCKLVKAVYSRCRPPACLLACLPVYPPQQGRRRRRKSCLSVPHSLARCKTSVSALLPVRPPGLFVTSIRPLTVCRSVVRKMIRGITSGKPPSLTLVVYPGGAFFPSKRRPRWVWKMGRDGCREGLENGNVAKETPRVCRRRKG